MKEKVEGEREREIETRASDVRTCNFPLFLYLPFFLPLHSFTHGVNVPQEKKRERGRKKVIKNIHTRAWRRRVKIIETTVE